MLTYEIHPILCDEIHYMLLEIEKHLKIVNASEVVQRTIDSYFVS
jgi:hypothetical protein